jgi:branched-chain amino acid transport system substrate-binding protein
MRVLGVIALALAVSTGAASARPSADPGLSSSEILIGGTVPLSGIAASYASVGRGAEAYFKYVNARGGVNGRKITFKYLDDAYDPSQTVENVRELIQNDQVFALFSVVGTNSNLAIRDFTNAAKVPVVFSAAGATTFGRDYAKYPYTIGYLPPYGEEGAVYAKHVLASSPKKAKIAVLYQADDYGKDLLNGLRKGLGAKNQKLLVKAVGYDPTAATVESEVADLKASGANTFMVFAFGKFAIQAVVYAQKLGWKPQLYINDVASASAVMKIMPQGAVQSAISIVFAKDPATPKWANDPGTKLGGQIIKKYVPHGDPKDGFLVAGMASGYSFVDALKRAGKSPTRDGLMKAVTSMSEASNPFLLPGIVVRTGAKSRFPITQVGLQRWQKGHWVLFGGLQTARP